MQFNTITRSLAPDLGAIPAEPLRPPPKAMYLLAVAFWASVIVVLALGSLRNSRLKADEVKAAQIQLDLDTARAEKTRLTKDVSTINSNFDSAKSLSLWATKNPFLQPAVAGILKALETHKIQISSLEVRRKPSEETVYILTLTVVAVGASGSGEMRPVGEALAAAGWRHSEFTQRGGNNSIIYETFISPP
jgi:hypothetical protein